ncbi:AraC family transcriptional regulator [Novosphingobium huizhouense]|uniref:AraC family transcriptional regulator n=1 Tax=Novosphingobium huizhouense TaxID=2866625 RepID=UPI00296EA1B9|nr:AraC family transcriptional regulator [Novosphingobium huizhouense]
MMNEQAQPAFDRALAANGHATRDGQPLSYNRAPTPDLAPWIARLYVTDVRAPDDYHLDCGLFCDTAFLRVQLSGAWTAQTLDGPRQLGRAAVFLGPNTRRMPISVTGSFTSIGVAFRPGCFVPLGLGAIADHLDRLVEIEALGFSAKRWLALGDLAGSPEQIVLAMEQELRAILLQRRPPEPDPVSARFEAAAFTDPNATVGALAADMGVEQRRLERIVRRDFGIPPKQVLRRARALDMASHLRGVADRDEADALVLRYYDQSHLIREFTALFGMSPRQFMARPQPLMTAALETRQARRLETIERIAPGGIRPWQ